MQKKTLELIKKFEQENEIPVSAPEALTCGILYARVTPGQVAGSHHFHHGRKFVSGPNEDGYVLVLRDPFVSATYSAESWGPMETINDFVKKPPAQILADKAAADKGQGEGCGTSCG